MTGGILQLVAKGNDDIFLIGNPQITFFKRVYRRYSNFSIDQLRLPITGKLHFGGSGISRIKRLADLVHKMYLVIELPDVDIYYHDFTYLKLDNILSSVDIYLTEYPQMVNKNDIVDKVFYDTIVKSTIKNTILQYKKISTDINNQIQVLGALESYSYNPKNQDKYLNPDWISQITQISSYHNLPISYKLYNDFSQSFISIDSSYNTIHELYDYFYKLYTNINGDMITMKNANDVINLIYNTIIQFKYSINDNNVTLLIGYQPLYIVESSDSPKLIQSSYIGDNLCIIDLLDYLVTYSNKDINIIEYFISKVSNISFISNYTNLDLYMTSILYLNNINYVISQLKSILQYTLQNNLNQLLTILNLLNFFKFSYRISNTPINKANVLIFGYLYQVTPTSSNILIDDTDTNLFFYDKDYTNIPEGSFYTNWVKNTVISFFRSVSDKFIGFDNTVPNNLKFKFVQYYNDNTYMDYLNMDETLNLPHQLNGILNTGSNDASDFFHVTTPISFDPVIYPGLNKKIAFLEFIPFLVVVNLTKVFTQYDGTGFFNNVLIQWDKTTFTENIQSYLDFLNVYTTDPIDGLQMTSDYLFSKTKNILTSSTRIISNLVTPLKIYTKSEIITLILSSDDKKTVIQDYMMYLDYMYISTLSDDEPTLDIVPDILFQQDAVMLIMASDLIYDILLSNVIETDKTKIIIAVMQIFRLYLLPLNEFPLYGRQLDLNLFDKLNNISSYITHLPIYIENFNYIHRLSCIWHIISESEMIAFDKLFQIKLLSTTYFRQYNTSSSFSQLVPSIGNTIGIGSTLQQAYELFVSYFINKRLNIDTIQDDSLETILNNTKLFAMDIIDPITDDDDNTTTFMGQTITNIQQQIVNKIYGIQSNITESNILLDFNKKINISNFHQYDSLFNIMSYGLSEINFNIVHNLDNTQNVTISNVGNISSEIESSDGVVIQMYKLYPTKTGLLDIILGKVYNDLQIVPMNLDVSLVCGNTYSTMKDEIPTINPPIGETQLLRGVLDFMMHIRSSLEKTMPDDVILYYDKILNYYEIFIEKQNSEISFDLILTTDSKEIDPALKRYISPTNTQGNLYTTNKILDIKGVNYNNSNIIKNYSGFSTVHGVIKFILDTIIYDMTISNLSAQTMLSLLVQPTTNLNALIIYWKQTVVNLSKYLSIMTPPSNTHDDDSFENSDLYNRLTPLRKTLDGSKLAEFAWSKYIGFNILDYVSIKIGGQLIDKHNGTWLYLDYLLNKKANQERGANIMLGNLPELTIYDTSQKRKKLLFIPLQFWFCKYFNTSLPLICLQHTDAELEIKLKNLDEIAFWNKNDTYFKRQPKLKSHIMADYICIDSDERHNFVSNKHEYLIETIQRNGIINIKNNIITNATITSINSDSDPEKNLTHLQIYFSNMCKEIVWIFKFNDVLIHDSQINNNIDLILNWNDFSINSHRKHILEFQLKFNGSYRENWKNASYFNLLHPYYKGYSSLTDNIFLYSYALHPQQLQPSGAVNLDKIYDFSLLANISNEMNDEIQNGTKYISWDVYCKSTNILRIMSGMAGITFYGSQM